MACCGRSTYIQKQRCKFKPVELCRVRTRHTKNTATAPSIRPIRKRSLRALRCEESTPLAMLRRSSSRNRSFVPSRYPFLSRIVCSLDPHFNMTSKLAPQRIRELLPDLHLGRFTRAASNTLTDIPGVLVSTHQINKSLQHPKKVVNTGVTVIVPRKD